jgi:hypothetical protein
MEIIKRFTTTDIAMVAEAIKRRQEKYTEDLTTSIGVVLMNYGDQYINIKCVKGEWHGKKKDIIPSRNVPSCPNGHRLLEVSLPPSLALVDGDMNGL